MLPPVGSVSMLPGHGRAGVVVDARPLGDAEGGRQLVALRIKAETGGDGTKGSGADSARSLNQASTGENRSPNVADNVTLSPVAAKRLDQLSAGERADLAELRQRDQQVRQEEKAHAAVAGDLAGPINYIYQRGPDGRQYAVGGSVSVQAQTVTGDPAEARRLSGRMAAAANAPTNPSAQDFATARQAYAFASQATTAGDRERRDGGIDLEL